MREDRPGIPAAASAGYDAATGDVIARLDADSVPPRDWVAQGAGCFCAENAPDAVTGTGQFFGSAFAMTRDAWLAAREQVRRGVHTVAVNARA